MRKYYYNKTERSDFFYINCHFWAGTEVKEHSHLDYYEILIQTDGETTTTIDGKSFTVKKGDAILILPSHSHKIEGNLSSHFNIAIQCEYFDTFLCGKKLSDNMSGFFRVSLPDEVLFFILSCIEKIDNSNTNDLSVLCVKTVINSIIIQILQSDDTNISLHKNNVKYYCSDAISKIDNGKYIDKSVSDVINIYPVSAPTFISEFKHLTGVTPLKYLQNKKISYAKNLLLTTQLSILEISLAVGYDSLSHFIKAFKNKYGMTPLAFRKNSIKNGEIHTKNLTKDHV